MRQLDGEAKKASANILKSLYESAASVKKQINTDKPEEAPKEEKEALIKKVQKPKVPHKEHIVEAADNNLATFRVYGTIGADATYPNEKTLEDLIKDCIDAAKTRYNVDVTIKDSGKESFRDEYELLVTGPKEATAEYVWDYFDGKNADSIEEIYDEYLVECGNTNLTEAEGTEPTESLRDKVAELQAYLDDTPEVPEDERASIQSQIDEILDEINYNENRLEESSLNEAPNPENEEANKKIRDVMVKGPDSKFYQDVLNMGYNVEKDRYNKNSYIIVNPKKDSYRGNRTGKGSILSAYPDEAKNKGKRAISGERIKKMKANKRNAIDYKNALDKDYSPRSTGERLKFGSGKAPGTHGSNQFINNNVHTENTYDDYAQDTNLQYPNSGTEKIREFRKAKENTKIYEDPRYNYMRHRDMYRDAGDYNVKSKSYYDDKVKRAEKDLKDFQDSITDRILKLQSYIDDAKSERNQARKNYNNEKKKIKKLLKKESEELTEARNPENDEANELIRTALNDPEYAKNHTSELRKHGIKYLKPEKGYDSGALEGKQGRRLNINKSDWRKNDVRDATNYSDGYYGDDAYSKGYKSDDAHADEIDLHQKNYKNSKSDYALAKNNIKRQRTKVANMKKKDAGKWNGKTFDAEQKLKGYENTLKRGITAGFAPSDSIHPDTDLKGFLNAKKHSDRPLAREKDPKYRRDRGVIVDPSNKDVEDYKWAKSERKYLDRERERIDQSNQEDQDRIAELKKRYAEDKARREQGFKNQEKDWKNVDTKINKKLDKYRQRMSNNK